MLAHEEDFEKKKKKTSPPPQKKGPGSLDPRVPGGTEGLYRAVPRAPGGDGRLARGGRACPQEDDCLVPVAREARLGFFLPGEEKEGKKLNLLLCTIKPNPHHVPGARRLNPAGPAAAARDHRPRFGHSEGGRRLDRVCSEDFGGHVQAGCGEQDGRVGRGRGAGPVRALDPVGEDQAVKRETNAERDRRTFFSFFNLSFFSISEGNKKGGEKYFSFFSLFLPLCFRPQHQI